MALQIAAWTRQFDLAVVVDDDPDIALAARLALRDLFERSRDLAVARASWRRCSRRRVPDAILLDLNFERGATDGREGLDCLGRDHGRSTRTRRW